MSLQISDDVTQAPREQGDARLIRPGAPAIYRENNASTPPQPAVPPFSAPSGSARPWRRMREFVRQSPPSSSTCASLRAALPPPPQARTSSVRSIRAEKLLLSLSSRPPSERALARI